MPTTGYIAVTFTPNFIGDHRICWRIAAGPYTCFTFSCGGSTAPCTVYIEPIDFENEACLPTDYNGYVQPSCEDPDTLDGAVFWEQEFTPTPTCNPVRLTCLGVEVDGGLEIAVAGGGNMGFDPPRPVSSTYIECQCAAGVSYNTNLLMAPVPLTDTTLFTPGTTFCGIWNGVHKVSPCWASGRGYDPCTPGTNPGLTGPPCSSGNPCYEFFCSCIYKPILTIAAPPPGGVQATAEFIMGYGAITSSAYCIIVNQGLGPAITQVFSNVPNTNLVIPVAGNPPGFGKQRFNVTVTAGKVTQVTPLNSPPGYYFTDNELFSFAPGDIGGVTGAIIQVKPGGTDYGKVIGVLVTNQGSGYISVPAVSYTTNSCGVRFALDLILQVDNGGLVFDPCPSFYPGTGCASSPPPVVVPSLPVGSTFILCYNPDSDRAAIPGSYTVEDDDNCCYDCIRVFVQAGVAPFPTITYTDCAGQEIRVVNMNSPSMYLNCVVRDSWVSTDPATIFTEIGLCIT